MERQPRLDRLVVVVRPQDARRPRRAMQAHGAVDLVRHDDLLPRNYIFWRSGDHQRASTIGKVWMRGEEGLDLASARNTEPGDAHPPAPSTRHSKREIGQRPHAGHSQGSSDARLKPELNAVADQRDWNSGDAQLLDGGGHGAGGRRALPSRPGEEFGRIIAVAGSGESRNAASDRPDDAA